MTTCVREADLQEAIATNRLAAFQEHLQACAICRDTVVVALAIQSDEAAARAEASMPTADVVWFRAQLRARAEAAQTAVRPVLIIQALGLASLVGAVAGVFGTSAWWLSSWASWLSSVAALAAAADSGMAMTTVAMRGVLLALAVWLVIAPVAVYLAATED